MMRHSGQSISLALGTAFIGYYIFGQGTILGKTFDPQQYIGALHLNFLIGGLLALIAVPIVWRGEKPAKPEQSIVMTQAERPILDESE